MSFKKSTNAWLNPMKSTWRIFKKKSFVVNSMSFAILALATTSTQAQVLPTGGTTTSGDASISTAGSTMTINQTTPTSIINWGTFSIGNAVGETVNFVNGTGATLNRVTGTAVTNIAGVLNGTGSVYLINPNGIIVDSTGKVNVGGDFVASTYGMTDQDFLNAQKKFASTGGAGTIEIKSGGEIKAGRDVGFVSARMINNGLVEGSRIAVAAAGDTGSATINSNNDVSAITGNANAFAINNTGTMRATGLQTINGRLVLRAAGTSNADIQNTGNLEAKSTSTTGSAINVRADNGGIVLGQGSNIDASNGGTAGSSTLLWAKNDVVLAGNVKSNTEGSITVAAAGGNWQNGTGTVKTVSGIPASLMGKSVTVLSGKNADGSRTNNDYQIASTGDSFRTLALHGHDTINTSNIASTSDSSDVLKTDGGTLSLIGKNINIQEDIVTTNKGDAILIAGAFDDTTNNFETEGTSNVDNLILASGWKDNTGVLNFASPSGATLLELCCHNIIKSGIGDNNVRADFTSNEAVFAYSDNAGNNYLSLRVEGFNNFDTSVVGEDSKEINTSSYFIANNVNNKINYDITAGAPVPSGKLLNPQGVDGEIPYFNDLGNVEIYSGMFNTADMKFDASLERVGQGTTQFDNSQLDGPLKIKADDKVIIVSGADANGNRFNVTDAQDGVNSENVEFGYTGTDSTYAQFKVVGFENINLGSSLLANNALDSLGDFDLYAYNDIKVSGETLGAGDDMLMIAHDDISIENASKVEGDKTNTLVADESNPTDLGGNGKIDLSADSQINGGDVTLYTRSQGDNNIAGTINGDTFVPGEEFVNTTTEQWETFYQLNKNSIALVNYKDTASPTPPPPPVQAPSISCDVDPSQAACLQSEGAPETSEFRIARTDNEFNPTGNKVAAADSADILSNEFQRTFDANYVSSYADGLDTRTRLAFTAALPFQLVGASLDATKSLATDLIPIPGFEAMATLALKPLTTITDVTTDIVTR